MIEAVSVFLDIVGAFFIAYMIGYSTFLFVSVLVGSSELYKLRRRKRLKNIFRNDYYVPISIIVPAYNESVTAVQTVESLLELDYRSYEIIVVDDGSRDDTAKSIIDAFSMHRVSRPIRRLVKCRPEEFVYETQKTRVPLTVIRKKNGGKAGALNMGSLDIRISSAWMPIRYCSTIRSKTYPARCWSARTPSPWAG